MDDSPDIAYKLFELINFVVEDRIVRPKVIEEMFNNLPASALDATERRDGEV